MKTKMVDMKMSKTQAEKSAPTAAMAPEREQYPWGLRISIDHEGMQKLGMEMPKAGEKMTLHAEVEVVDTHESSTADGGKNASCGMQICCMSLEAGDEGGMSDRLYPKTKGK